MKKGLLMLSLLALAAPAQATGGMICRTAGPKPVEVSLTVGHAAGSPVVAARLVHDGRSVAVRAVQWWADSSELRLLLVDPEATREELLLKARRSGRTYDGTVRRAGQSRWVRCREG